MCATLNFKLNFFPSLALSARMEKGRVKLFLPGGSELKLQTPKKKDNTVSTDKKSKSPAEKTSIFSALSSVYIEKFYVYGRLNTGENIAVAGLLSTASIIFFNLICNIFPSPQAHTDCLILPDTSQSELQLDFVATLPMGVVIFLIMQILSPKEKI